MWRAQIPYEDRARDVREPPLTATELTLDAEMRTAAFQELERINEWEAKLRWLEMEGRAERQKNQGPAPHLYEGHGKRQVYFVRKPLRTKEYDPQSFARKPPDPALPVKTVNQRILPRQDEHDFSWQYYYSEDTKKILRRLYERDPNYISIRNGDHWTGYIPAGISWEKLLKRGIVPNEDRVAANNN